MLNPHVALECLQLHEGRMIAHLTLEVHASPKLDRMYLVNMSLQVEHLLKLPLIRADVAEAGVSILTSYGENPHYVKLPIFSEFMENSAKFMKNSGLTKWTQNLR